MKMLTKPYIWVTLLFLIGLCFYRGSVASDLNCDKMMHWSETNPPVNQQHIFCGEWNRRKNRPAGFHSRPGGENPTTVGRLQITQRPNARGLYGVRWSYAGHPERKKFSSMFPDTCNREQVLESIVYAANHQKPCPAGAPHWTRCGPNRPDNDSEGYCEARDRTFFTIGFATLKNSNKINTAFPIVE